MQLRHSRYTLQVTVCQMDAFTQIIDRQEDSATTMHVIEANVLLAPRDPYCNAKMKTA